MIFAGAAPLTDERRCLNSHIIAKWFFMCIEMVFRLGDLTGLSSESRTQPLLSGETKKFGGPASPASSAKGAQRTGSRDN